ncbi:MAG: YicC family protein [Desulfobacterota bacterium]|nr:YicC family protein [Thermodesulfobacteriota bacterium]
MLYSMTGYGNGEVVCGGRRISLEVRSVNHRFLDISLKLPRTLVSLETEMKQYIAAHLRRGKIDVTIQYAGQKNNGTAILDIERAVQVRELLQQLKAETECPGDIDLALLLQLKDLFVVEGEEPIDCAVLWHALQPCLEKILRDMRAMQKTEGMVIARDLAERIQHIEQRLEAIGARAPAVRAERVQALKERVATLCEGVALDEQRMLQEIALLADRSDITEELVRVRSHVQQFRHWLASDEPVGKRLDFLIQELFREINTIGSKAADAGISIQVVEIKNELEKIREQVQNVM